MSTEIYYTLRTLQCWVCDAPVALAPRQNERAKERGETFYCSKGCRLSFGKSENDRLKEQLEAANARANRLYDEKKSVEYQVRAEKAAKTRIKNRVSKGVCPCCNRSFASLARHMRSQHPDYTDEQ